MWRPWNGWTALAALTPFTQIPTSQAGALRNARHASAALAQRRLERDEIEVFLARHRQRVSRRVAA